MRINSSQQMFQHIENGDSLKLNKQGQLETQSAAGRFFQKIGDAFRSLSASGRSAIEARNTKLYTAMANLARSETLVNPSRADIQQPQIGQAQRNTMCANLAIAGQLAKLPPEARTAARAFVAHQLNAKGILNKDAEAVRNGAKAVMENISNDPVLSNALQCTFSRSATQLRPLMNELVDDMKKEFQSPTQQAHVNNGIHKTYIKDAARSSLRSINGQPPDKANLGEQLKSFIPNEKISSFVSFVASQAGLEGSLFVHLATPHGTNPNPNSPDIAGFQSRGMTLATPNHGYEINVQDGKATIRLDIDVALQPLGVPPKSHGLGGSSYAVTMEIDLNQDMTGKTVPDFTLSGECSPFDPE